MCPISTVSEAIPDTDYFKTSIPVEIARFLGLQNGDKLFWYYYNGDEKKVVKVEKRGSKG
jgi:hypothetical protein